MLDGIIKSFTIIPQVSAVIDEQEPEEQEKVEGQTEVSAIRWIIGGIIGISIVILGFIAYLFVWRRKTA